MADITCPCCGQKPGFLVKGYARLATLITERIRVLAGLSQRVRMTPDYASQLAENLAMGEWYTDQLVNLVHGRQAGNDLTPTELNKGCQAWVSWSDAVVAQMTGN